MAQVVVRQERTADALARMLVRATLVQRSVPAHAERVAAARRRRTRAGKISSRRRIAESRIVGDGSFSIDQQRYNAQFGGQVFYEIKGGKIVGMLKDVAYQMRTPDFWNSMDMIGGKKSYRWVAASSTVRDSPGRSTQ